MIFTRLAKDDLAINDLDYCSHKTFRKYVDELCSRADSGWTRVTIPVKVVGFPKLEARGCAAAATPPPQHPTTAAPAASPLPPFTKSAQPLRLAQGAACVAALADAPPPVPQVASVELVYRDVKKMLRGFIRKFAKLEEYCWRWAYTREADTAGGEEVIEHPASAAWWKEQAQKVAELGGSLLALQLYSDDTTLNNKRSRSAYPLYCVPINGSFDLYKLLFPVSVVAYMPVLKCPNKGGRACRQPARLPLPAAAARRADALPRTACAQR